MKRLASLFGRRGDPAAARAANERVMAAALDPSLYTGGVATDTFDGRFEMTALFASLAMRRLRHAGPPGRALADALYRRLFSGFDYALREEGTGDATIAKKVRGLGERFYGLARAVDAGLDAEDSPAAVEAALVRNGLGGTAPAALGAYVMAADAALKAQTDAEILAGAFGWPPFNSM